MLYINFIFYNFLECSKLRLAMPAMFSIWTSMLLVNWFISLQKKVLVALEDAGVFTSGGLIKDKVKAVLLLL